MAAGKFEEVDAVIDAAVVGLSAQPQLGAVGFQRFARACADCTLECKRRIERLRNQPLRGAAGKTRMYADCTEIRVYADQVLVQTFRPGAGACGCQCEEEQ